MWISRAIALFSLTLPGFFTQPAPETEIVLARCKESISWVGDMGYGSITTVYEKCGSTEGPGRHVPRPNVGREGGTYLQHIVDRYDSLADWTVFSQAGDPTYGYRGHRLGGGHMMRNVRFQDYVEAASSRATQPRFYIFTTILAMRDWTMFQCIRRGYGEGYLPDNDHLRDKMCGRIDDWTQWFEFPDWFKDMVIRLQEEQHAPFIHFKLEEVLKLFDFKASHNLIFFAQGARFAISKAAIQMRPKSYYARLLPYFNTSDPWVGYFMEWLWWYVLGGPEAPCGFEAAALVGHYKWANSSKGHMMVAQEVSGVQGNIQFNGATVINSPQTLQVASGSQIKFLPGSTTTFNAPPTMSGDGSLLADTATLVFNAPASIGVPASFDDSSVSLASGVLMDFTGGDVAIANTKVPGSGAIHFHRHPSSKNGSVILVTNSKVDATMRLFGMATGSRRTSLASYSTGVLCGAAQGAVALDSQSALELRAQCQATGQSYSNAISSLSTATGCIVAVTGVSSSSLPALISLIDNPMAIKLEVVNSGSGGFSTDILQYGTSSGSCYNGWKATTDNCQSGYTCSVSSSKSAGTGQCTVKFSQSASGSDQGLLGLLALLALIPIIAFLVWYYGYRNRGMDEDIFLENVPNAAPIAGIPVMDDAVKEPPEFAYLGSSDYPPVFRGIYEADTGENLPPSTNAGPSPVNGNAAPTSFGERGLSPVASSTAAFSSAAPPDSFSTRNGRPNNSRRQPVPPLPSVHFFDTAWDFPVTPSRRHSVASERFSPPLPPSPTNGMWPSEFRHEGSSVALARKLWEPERSRPPSARDRYPIPDAFPRPITPFEDRWAPSSARTRHSSERRDGHLMGQPSGHRYGEPHPFNDDHLLPQEQVLPPPYNLSF